MASPGDMNDSDDDGDVNVFSEEFRGSGPVYNVRRISLAEHKAVYCLRAATIASSIEDGEKLSDDERGRLAVSMLSTITLMALETTPSQVRERGSNISQLTRFPELPASSMAASSPGGSSVSYKRRHGEGSDRDNTSNDSYGDDDDAPSILSNMGISTGRRHRRNSPLKNQWNTQRDPSTFRLTRAFCTQGCLRGLVHGEGMDPGCPNVLLHMQAARRDSGSLWISAEHALTLDEPRELVQLQLLSNAEQDCDCILERGLVGSIGYLFKITVTGYGYTFVAKGVGSLDNYRLLREVHVYERLAEQQGVTIPVRLGIVPLLLPYPMTNGVLITHMLLMSYANLGLHSRRAQRFAEMGHVDLEREEERTLRELEAVGLVDRDYTSNGSLTWNRELQRVMKIYFDHASAIGSKALSLYGKAGLPSGRRGWDKDERH
ncbi:hypothetical protein BROUX41_006811 [Berkeleyomyces rouxiae]